MRPLLPLLFVVLLGGLAAFLFFGEDRKGADHPDPVVSAEGLPGQGGAVQEIRTAAPAKGIAPVTLRYRLVDAVSGDPIPGGRILRAQDAAVLGTTDAEGCATVHDGRISTLVFGAPGYLLEHYFDRPQRAAALAAIGTKGETVPVLLQPDELTLRCRLRFQTPEGDPARGVRFRITCLEEPAPHPRSVPSARLGAGAAIPPELRQAWQRHALLATMDRPDFDVGVSTHLAGWSGARPFTCGAEGIEVSFLAPGLYRVDAGTDTAFRQQTVEVVHGGDILVRLQAGGFVAGRAVDDRDGKPVAGAMVSLSVGSVTQSGGLTDDEGRFRLGPLAPKAMRLVLHHPAFEPFELPSVHPVASATVTETLHRLRARPTYPVFGRVRLRPGLEPVVGAKVRLLEGGHPVATGETDGRGEFRLESYLTEPTLEITAPDCLDYAENLNADEEAGTFDLLPATAAERVRLGLSALVFGRVFDAQRKPAPHRGVRIRPVASPNAAAIGGRRILRGALPLGQELVRTDAEGRFELEWPRAEDLRVAAPRSDAGRHPQEEQALTTVLGRRHELVFRDPR